MSKLFFGARARLIVTSVKNGRLLTRVNQEVTVAVVGVSTDFRLDSLTIVHPLPIAEDFRNGNRSWILGKRYEDC
jgi:hypothetical protein